MLKIKKISNIYFKNHLTSGGDHSYIFFEKGSTKIAPTYFLVVAQNIHYIFVLKDRRFVPKITISVELQFLKCEKVC